MPYRCMRDSLEAFLVGGKDKDSSHLLPICNVGLFKELT